MTPGQTIQVRRGRAYAMATIVSVMSSKLGGKRFCVRFLDTGAMRTVGEEEVMGCP